MNVSKRRVWTNWFTGILAVCGLAFGIINSLIGFTQATEIIPQTQLLNAILAVLSGLWLYVLLSSVYHENALDEVSQKISELASDEIGQGRLESLVLEKIDDKLRPMFQQHLRSVFSEITEAYETQTVVFRDPLKFKSYYLAVLRAFPAGSVLTATSLATREYFWDGNIEPRMAEFIQKRGKKGIIFRRIFYVSTEQFNNSEKLSDEQIGILRRQLEAGIDVYIYPCDELPRNFVLADGEATIAWVVATNKDRTIREVKATCKPNEVQKHAENLEHILEIAKQITEAELLEATTSPNQ